MLLRHKPRLQRCGLWVTQEPRNLGPQELRDAVKEARHANPAFGFKAGRGDPIGPVCGMLGPWEGVTVIVRGHIRGPLSRSSLPCAVTRLHCEAAFGNHVVPCRSLAPCLSVPVVGFGAGHMPGNAEASVGQLSSSQFCIPARADS